MSPKLAQDESQRVIPRWQFVHLHTDRYETIVDQLAIAKIGFIAFAGLADFVGESLRLAAARLQIGFSGLGVGEGGHGCGQKTTQRATYGCCAWG